ncbi:MAG: helix-turn-helix domain-containing protein [Deltaproteobacteria bacterium]
MTELGGSLETALRDLIRESIRDGLLDAFERVRADLIPPREPQEVKQADWITVQEVAKRLEVTAETVRAWISTKKLAASRPSGKPRGRLRVSMAELSRFLAVVSHASGTSRARPDPRSVAAKILSSGNSK